jgi:hypothetical protein
MRAVCNGITGLVLPGYSRVVHQFEGFYLDGHRAAHDITGG